MNKNQIYTKSRDDWRTPDKFVDALCRLLGIDEFRLDLCADESNYKGLYYSDNIEVTLSEIRQDGAVLGDAFINPPFSRKDFYPLAIGHRQHFLSITAVMPFSPETIWFRHLEERANTLVIPDKRIHYESPDGGKSNASFPSCAMVFLPRKIGSINYERVTL